MGAYCSRGEDDGPPEGINPYKDKIDPIKAERRRQLVQNRNEQLYVDPTTTPETSVLHQLEEESDDELITEENGGDDRLVIPKGFPQPPPPPPPSSTTRTSPSMSKEQRSSSIHISLSVTHDDVSELPGAVSQDDSEAGTMLAVARLKRCTPSNAPLSSSMAAAGPPGNSSFSEVQSCDDSPLETGLGLQFLVSPPCHKNYTPVPFTPSPFTSSLQHSNHQQFDGSTSTAPFKLDSEDASATPPSSQRQEQQGGGLAVNPPNVTFVETEESMASRSLEVDPHAPPVYQWLASHHDGSCSDEEGNEEFDICPDDDREPAETFHDSQLNTTGPPLQHQNTQSFDADASTKRYLTAEQVGRHTRRRSVSLSGGRAGNSMEVSQNSSYSVGSGGESSRVIGYLKEDLNEDGMVKSFKEQQARKKKRRKTGAKPEGSSVGQLWGSE